MTRTYPSGNLGSMIMLVLVGTIARHVAPTALLPNAHVVTEQWDWDGAADAVVVDVDILVVNSQLGPLWFREVGFPTFPA